MTSRGQHSRGYLPHWDIPGSTQAITYRLADALPTEVLRRLLAEAPLRPDGSTDEHAARARMERWLDAGHGSCILARPEIATLVRDAWRHHDGERYRLIAWVIMPNHVHVAIRLLGRTSLTEVVRSWKTWTARRINELLGTHGQVWQEDYWDRLVRDEGHLWSVLRYIERNPVDAGLVDEVGAWPWSSASDAGLEPRGPVGAGAPRSP